MPFRPQDYPLAPLEEDCALLKTVLDDIIHIECGEEMLTKVRRPRGRIGCASVRLLGGMKGPSQVLRQPPLGLTVMLCCPAAAQEDQDACAVLSEPPRRRGEGAEGRFVCMMDEAHERE